MTIEFDGQNNKLGTTTANSVTIKTNDTDAITIDSSQKVGVGVSNPSVAFEVNTGANGRRIMFTQNATNLNEIRSTTSDQTTYANLRYDATEHIFETSDTEIARFTSTGLAIGGTGTANTLDDYEEGTWTPSFGFSSAGPTAGETTGTGFYTKVGNMVTVWGAVTDVNVTGASGDARIKDLPFTSKTSAGLVGWMGSLGVSGNTTFNGYLNCDVQDGFNYVRPLENQSGGSRDVLAVADCVDGATDVYFSVSYQVD